MNPYKYKMGQLIDTDGNTYAKRSNVAHVVFENAVDGDSDGILQFTNLGSEAQSIESGFGDMPEPRNVVIDGSAANIIGDVKVYGTRAGKEINETIALNGVTASAGNLAFDEVTKVDLPAQTNTPTKQVATVAVTGGATGAGTVVLTVTAAALPGEHTKTVEVEVTADDDSEAEVATKVVAALNTDEVISEYFTAEVSTASVVIEAKTVATQDATVNIAVTADEDNTGVTLGDIDVDTIPGVAPDQVSVGWGTKLGLPYMLEADEQVIIKLLGKAADSGKVVADANELEKNTFTPNGALNGETDVDLYIVV
jgi:hypothetical protein